MKLSMKFYRYGIVLSFNLFMNIQFLLFYMMFYIDAHVTYSFDRFIYINLFKMESIVLPIKSSVAYNEENITMLYFTNVFTQGYPMFFDCDESDLGSLCQLKINVHSHYLSSSFP